MSKERFIPVFIDAKPQENIDPSVEEHRCFVGMTANHMYGVPDLKAYKYTRTKTRKLKAAQRIIESLHNGFIDVAVVAVVGKTNGQFIKWPIDIINRNRERLGAEWEVENSTPISLKWNGYTFPRSNVLGVSLYAGMLPIIALEAEILAHGNPIKTIKLSLDRLPHNALGGMELMDALSSDPEVAEMWKQNCERGFSFEYGILDSFEGPNRKTISGKEHPNSILVDWMAVSCLAKTNPDQLMREGSYNDTELESICAIWDAAKEHSFAKIHDVDNQETIRRIVEHKKRKKEISSTTELIL